VFKPSARSTGDVVAVRTVDTNMRKNNLKPKNIPTMTPSVLKAIGPNRKSTSCPVRSALNTKVNKARMKTVFALLA